MAKRDLPGIGLKGNYAPGEDGWGDDQNLNLLKLSVLVQGGVAKRLAAVPVDPAPAQGDTYILTAAPHAQNVAAYDGAAWAYFPPVEGWLLYDRDADVYVKYDGAAWVVLATGGGGGGGGADYPDFDGNAGKVLAVNADEDGVEWIEAAVGGGSGGSGLIGFWDKPGDWNNNSFADVGATQGDFFDCTEATKILGITAAIGRPANSSYRAGLYEINPANGNIVAVVALSSVLATGATGRDAHCVFPLDEVVTLQAGKRYGAYVTRLDGDAATPTRFLFQNGTVSFASNGLTLLGTARYSKNTPLAAADAPNSYSASFPIYTVGLIVAIGSASGGGGGGGGEGGGSSGALQVIARIVLTEGQNSISVDDLPHGYDDLQFVLTGESDRNNSDVGDVTFIINDDTSNSWDYAGWTKYGAGQDYDVGPIGAGWVSGPNKFNSSFPIEGTLFGYARDDIFKGYRGQAILRDNNNNYFTRIIDAQWRKTAAVQKIAFTTNGGSNFTAGTVLTVYGRGGTAAGSGGGGGGGTGTPAFFAAGSFNDIGGTYPAFNEAAGCTITRVRPGVYHVLFDTPAPDAKYTVFTSAKWNVDYNNSADDQIGNPRVGVSRGAALPSKTAQGFYLSASDPFEMEFWFACSYPDQLVAATGSGGGGGGSTPVVIETMVPALVNGWHDFGVGYEPIVAKKINGFVVINGVISGGNPDSTMFTMPEGWRPLGGHVHFPSQATDKTAAFDIKADGTVYKTQGDASGYFTIHAVYYVGGETSGGGGGSADGRWAGKNLAVIGDSITEQAPGGVQWHTVLANKLGMAGRKIDGVGGTTMATAAARVTALGIGGSDLLLIYLGTNDTYNGGGRPIGALGDAANAGTMFGDTRATIEAAMAANPKIRMAFLAPIQRTDNTAVNGQGKRLVDYVDTIKACAAFYAIPVFDMYREGGFNVLNAATLLPDGLHPGADGQGFLGRNVAAFAESI